MKKAIFLDRDGTINFDSNYVYRLEDLKVLDSVPETLHYLKNRWFLLIIITNQSGIAKGYFTLDDFYAFNNELEKQIDINFDKIYVCPHKVEDNCSCRKPKPWMLLDAQKHFDIDFSQSYFIWDKDSDIECGKSVWCKAILMKWGQYQNISPPDYIVSLLSEVKNIIF